MKRLNIFLPIIAVMGLLYAGDQSSVTLTTAPSSAAATGGLAGFRESDPAAEEKYAFAPRGMLIYLDEQETILSEPFSKAFIVALAAQAGPIMVSASLASNVFNSKDDDASLRDFLATKNGITDVKEQDEKLLGMRKVIQEVKEFLAAHFDGTKWIIKEIRKELYLFIPKAYLTAHGISVDEVNKDNMVKDATKKSTMVELQLGLKVNHMASVPVAAIGKPVLPAPEDLASYFIQALYDEITQESAIFCTRSAYAATQINLPLWSLYMGGHGFLDKAIAFITLKDFQKVLAFLEEKINVRLLIYSSCYAAGVNAEIIYRDVKKGIQRTYSYAIITQALTDAPTRGMSDKYTGLPREAFDEFFKLIELPATEELPYEAIAASIFDVVSKDVASSPQIKLPGIEWFSVIASSEYIVSIGSIMAKTRDPQKPLDVAKFMGSVAIAPGEKKERDPKILLLYAPQIPFEVIISAPHLSAIVSMIPGYAVHVLEKVSSPTMPVNELLNVFMKVDLLGVFKLFFIKTLQGRDTVYLDVCIVASGDFTKKPSAYFKDEKTAAEFGLTDLMWGKKSGESSNYSLGRDEKKEYEQLLERVGQPLEYTRLEFKSEDEMNKQLPERLRRCVIGTMLADFDNYYVVLDVLYKKLVEGEFVWIKTLYAQPPSIKRLVMFNDVIVAKQKDSLPIIYYTRSNARTKRSESFDLKPTGEVAINFDYKELYRKMLPYNSLVFLRNEDVENIKKFVGKKVK